LSDYLEYLNPTRTILAEAAQFSSDVEAAKEFLIGGMKNGGTVFFCGNGGSAADAQHWAAELVGRFRINGKPLPAHALTVDTSAITAIGNDFDFSSIFSRQLEAFAKSTDILIGISTSGNSLNVVKAMEKARELGIKTIGITGGNGGQMRNLSDCCVVVPSFSTEVVQHVHATVGHYLMGMVEEALREVKGS
jgi:D-sedoheptulose 7-phosphate isomerase